MIPFYALSKTGKTDWWRYLLTLLGIGIIWIGGTMMMIGIMIARSLDWSQISESGYLDKWMSTLDFNNLLFDPFQTLLLVASVAIVFPAVYFLGTWIHQRKPVTFLTARKQWDWKRFWIASGVWILITTIPIILFEILSKITNEPSIISWSSINWGTFTLFFFPLMIVIFFQCLAEEILFRGYLFQSAYHLVRNIRISLAIRLVFAMIAPTVLFGLAHMSNEPFQTGWLAAANYFALALMLQIITHKDNGLEFASGIHVANNVFAFLILSSSIENFGNTSLIQQETTPEMLNSLSTILYSLLTYALVIWLLCYSKWSKQWFYHEKLTKKEKQA